MKLEILKPAKSLNKAYLKQDLKRNQIELFKTNLNTLFTRANEADKKKESEEHFKNLVADFLKDTFYKPNNEINTSGRTDLVIHNGKSSADTVGVIIEAKRPTNAAEMITKEKPNSKALHELLHYYMQERYAKNNKEIKHLIATNIYEWFVFDGAEFEKFFFENQKLKKQYKEWNDGLFGLKQTDWFYQEIAKPFIEKELDKLTCTYFNLREVEKAIQQKEADQDKKLIDLYKILSPEHLLKKSFANDSNTLNKDFYNELLHIIGLSETNDKGKKIIRKKTEDEKDDGSLLENTINILRVKNKLSAFENPKQFGETEEEQLFSIALELCITWLNRILFLKLLEGQLIKYHKGDKRFSFLNFNRISDFDEVNELFFEVLAVPTPQRTQSVKDKFGSLPYLNSSLFDESSMEAKTLSIAGLKNRLEIPVYHHTVLKDASGKKLSGDKNTLQYLFEFLDAYDFSSDSTAEIQEQNKTIINASVLGLIFEKINGYKDGSFFTPGFITMYMCRETIRKAVIQKFNEQHHWNCSNFNALYNKLEKISNEEANATINSLKICDPAVGSGHFLVSALNEIIAIKCDLGILIDSEGKRLKGYNIVIENDELIITCEDEIFEYNYKDKESRRIQETLFHEKQNIIENCLFGVDINPKSVMICRLRLWIELLKNAYYTKAGEYTELETLPNIDINIKCGNSLISRFAVKDDVFEKIPNFIKKVDDYKFWVNQYKNAKDKKLKNQLKGYIELFKNEFKKRNPRLVALEKQISKAGREYLMKYKPAIKKFDTVFTPEQQKTKKQLEDKFNLLVAEKQKIESDKIFASSFEWRFEFPEVLDEKGKFGGFDVVIGNPPYLNVELIDKLEKEYYKNHYPTFYKRSDIFNLFIDFASSQLTEKGCISFIVPSIVLNNLSYKPLRDQLLSNNWLQRVCYTGGKVFDEATVDTVILFINKTINKEIELIDALDFFNPKKMSVSEKFFEKFDNVISVSGDSNSNKMFDKIFKFDNINIEQHFNIFQGIVTGNNPVYIFDEKEQWQKPDIETKLLHTLLHGRDFHKWIIKNTERKILYVSEQTGIKAYPKALKYLSNFKDELVNSKSADEKTTSWWCLHRPREKENLDITPKIIIQNTRNERLKPRVVATVDEIGVYGSQGLNFVIPTTKEYSVYFLIGIINSALINYLFATKFLNLAIKAEYVKQISFPKPSKKQVEAIEAATKEILKLKKQNENTTALEKEIDKLVYELYGITSEEQKIIEEAQT